MIMRYEGVKQRMRLALQAAGRTPSAADLVAVSKTFLSEEILPVILAGHRKFGENRVQESHTKWPTLKQKFPGIELHLIGPLQSNKVDEAVELFDVIQTIDRPKIAAAVATACQKSRRQISCLIQVNIGSEPQKAGIAPDAADSFILSCIRHHGLNVTGVMCIPPVDENPVPYFETLKNIAARNHLKEISMGMSDDFEEALAHGSTLIRVGSAIFGKREKA